MCPRLTGLEKNTRSHARLLCACLAVMVGGGTSGCQEQTAPRGDSSATHDLAVSEMGPPDTWTPSVEGAPIPDTSAPTRTIRYVDADVADVHLASATPDCIDYDPATKTCGSGSATVYKTMKDVKAFLNTLVDGVDAATILFDGNDTWKANYTADACTTDSWSGS